MYRIWFERGMPDAFAPLLDGVVEEVRPGTGPDPLATAEDAEALIASSVIHYDAEALDRIPGLRVISRTGIGFDKIDVHAATERGIAVCIAPDGPTISTAEHTMMLLLAAAKQVKEAEAALRRGGRRSYFAAHTGMELAGKTLALIGFGRIAHRVARAAQALDMTLVAHDPYVDDAEMTAHGVRPAGSVKAALAAADAVSLHLPLNENTRHIIDRAAIAHMRPGCIFVNTARGGLVEEEALLEALESGHVAGAGLDVTDPEPASPHHPLLQRDDVIVTPHVAAATADGKHRLYEIAIGQALDVLRGQRPPHLVNPDVWEHRRPAHSTHGEGGP